jgi:rRNA maturation protein Rpf1
VLITTGKGPDRETRLSARALFLAVPGSRLENRGKRTLVSMVKKAQKLHYSRVCAVYKDRGHPCTLAFIRLDGPEEWEWLTPILNIRKVKFASQQPRAMRQSARLEISGSRAKTLNLLLAPRNASEDEAESSITAGAKSLSILLGKRKLLELGVSYEK